MLSFDYWSDGGSVEFNVDLIPDSLPEIHPVATTTQQTMNWIFSSSSSDMNSSQIRYFNDRTVPNPQNIAIINKHLYKCDDCTLTYTKNVTKGNAYGTLNTPKRYGWDFLGWYLEDGTKVESTSINNIKGNHTITAKWSHHNYEVKLVGVNGTIENAPIWYYRAGWENASTKIIANKGYTTNGATVSCTGSARASISGDYLYLSNITEDQTCTVTFKKSTTLLSKLLSDNPTIKTRTNFNTTFTETNTGTLYKSTESIAGSTAEDVYYFAGDAKNNWVKFGKHQTTLIRYRGYYISNLSDYREYSTMEECTSATSWNYKCTEFKFYSAGDDMYWRIIRTNADGSIRLLYSGTSPNTTKGYLGISLFNTLCPNPKYVGYMYGDSGTTLGEARANTNDSTIKTYIDNWYEKNFTAYTNYLSNDAVYCNDRELASGSTYTTTSSSIFYFKPYERLYTNKTPTYDCKNKKDAFSVNNLDAKLKYPVALMTADEIAYAGGVAFMPLISPYAWYYLNSTGDSITGSDKWLLLSPGSWSDGCRNLWSVLGSDRPGRLRNDRSPSRGVRPAISLKSCVLYKSGDGSAESPYEIVENGGC